MFDTFIGIVIVVVSPNPESPGSVHEFGDNSTNICNCPLTLLKEEECHSRVHLSGRLECRKGSLLASLLIVRHCWQLTTPFPPLLFVFSVEIWPLDIRRRKIIVIYDNDLWMFHLRMRRRSGELTFWSVCRNFERARAACKWGAWTQWRHSRPSAVRKYLTLSVDFREAGWLGTELGVLTEINLEF